MRWMGGGEGGKPKKAQGGKIDKEREKLINRGDSERKSLLHFDPVCLVRAEAQKQCYSFGDFILREYIQNTARLLGTEKKQFYPLQPF